MTCAAPKCPEPPGVGSVFCEVHAAQPAHRRAGWLSAAKRRQTMKVDASNISQRLWVGAAPPVDHAITGVDVVVLCAVEIQPPRLAFGGQVIRCPLPDDVLSTRELGNAIITARTVAQEIATGSRVLVTCAQGRNRSALVAGLALGRLTRMTADQVIQLIRTRRRPDCLTNQAFVEYLRRFIGHRVRATRPADPRRG